MNKKILVLFIFVVIASISTASAFDLNDLFKGSSANNSTGENVNISGIGFKIPKGFKEINDNTDKNRIDNSTFNITSKTFTNDKNDTIIISVTTYNTPTNDSWAKDASEGGNKTTINGVEGYTFASPGFEGFTFSKDGKLVFFEATNKNLLNEIKVA